MSKEAWLLAKSASWLVTIALCWTCANKGYTVLYPRFDWWFWTVAFGVEASLFVGMAFAWFQK